MQRARRQNTCGTDPHLLRYHRRYHHHLHFWTAPVRVIIAACSQQSSEGTVSVATVTVKL